MIKFRKMIPDDLDVIYKDEQLRALITFSSKGTKFGVVIDDDGYILGGATGYTDGEAAMIENLIVKSSPSEVMLIDGLIRSVIYILSLQEIKAIFINGKYNSETYKRVGFNWLNNYPVPRKYHIKKMILQDTAEEGMWIDVQMFFDNNACCHSNSQTIAKNS
ncbi:MAG: hypothetical protein ACFWUE_11450 [Xylanivirga thermophila]|jgi:N-acetylglutamate synthase-like GNAT family acetyltransferase|uniref:hypothetical protein n=1 Tax=Xylanivirga thermophila TaxID=2496273 RepID=UPI00101D23CE|nr:hypothetical protein [Xylanivirga thermophila]